MRGNRLVAAAAVVGVLAVAAVACWASYWHAVKVIEAHGTEDRLTAHLMPVLVDGMIFVSSLVYLYCARAGKPVTREARITMAIGITATVATNVGAGLARPPWGPIIAGFVAVAWLRSYELLMSLIRVIHEESDQSATTSDITPDAPRRPNQEADKTSDRVNVDDATKAIDHRHEEASTDTGRTRVDMSEALSLVSHRPKIPAVELAEKLQCSPRQASRIRKKLLAQIEQSPNGSPTPSASGATGR